MSEQGSFNFRGGGRKPPHVDHGDPLPTDPEYDGELARRNVDRALAALFNGEWWSVQRLAVTIEATETSASSALRDLRKLKYGGWNVVRRRLENGLSEYRLFPNDYVPSVEERTGAA